MLRFSSFTVLGVLGFLFLGFIYYSSALVYRLSLVIFVAVVLSTIVFSELLPGLMGLLILLIYVGAMIIIIGYICAVSPNLKYNYTLISFLLSGFVVRFLVSVFVISLSSCQVFFDSLSPSFLLSDLGLLDLFYLGLFMVLILIISTYIHPSFSSFRSSVN
jgi:hypothetical protein